MFKVNKNDKALKELLEYSQTTGLDLKSVMLSSEHLQNVADIFYAHMPKLIRFSMSKEKFTAFYDSHKESFVNSFKL